LTQRDYDEARKNYKEALELFHSLGEPAMEAQSWHGFGRIAEEQREWAVAEDAYRRSAEIKVRLGDAAGVAVIYNQLARVAEGAGHLAEAEGWYRRTLGIDERFGNQKDVARGLSNLAALLRDEAQTGNTVRLAEARHLAERALAIREMLEGSEPIWLTFNILADIAALEGRVDAARGYRRRERAAFAAFAGSRWQIDQQYGQFIALIAAAAQGDEQVRAALEAEFPKMEASDWGQVPPVIRRIWAGEREYDALVEELGWQDALLVLRVLEEIGG
jgi:tetratricopeptide (TPR) repeat protein